MKIALATLGDRHPFPFFKVGQAPSADPATLHAAVVRIYKAHADMRS